MCGFKGATGRKSGSNHDANRGSKRAVKKMTSREHRRNLLFWSRDILKSFGTEECVNEPVPAVGGYYIS